MYLFFLVLPFKKQLYETTYSFFKYLMDIYRAFYQPKNNTHSHKTHTAVSPGQTIYLLGNNTNLI